MRGHRYDRAAGSRVEHGADVRRPGRIAEDRRLEVAAGQTMADGKSEDVDHFVHMRSDEMRAKDEVGFLFYQRLVAIDRLGHTARRIPLRGAFAFYAILEPGTPRVFFAHAHARDRWQREGDAGDAAIV